MTAARQKRQSCEACRNRKLKCSGQKTGCSRCRDLDLVCKFKDRGLPGRPRKWIQLEAAQQTLKHSVRRDGSDDVQDLTRVGSNSPDGQSFTQEPIRSLQRPDQPSIGESLTSFSGAPPSSSTEVADLATPCLDGDLPFDFNDPSLLPVLAFNTTSQLDTLSLDFFRPCLTHAAHGRTGSVVSVASNAPSHHCSCAEDVFETIRVIKRGPINRAIVGPLRTGIALFERLLTCQLCYDVSKPPRVTLQNVLLIGRLLLEVTTGYQRLLKWLGSPTGVPDRETVYLTSGDGNTSLAGFEVSRDKVLELVMHSLKGDAARLEDLGGQFATRQHNRHLIGHETCPDPEGRCWKDSYEVDPDPSDICPCSAGAKILTPCYRVVDEVRSKIELFASTVP